MDPWKKQLLHFFPYPSWSLLSIRFIAVAFWSEEDVLWKRDPRDQFWSRPGFAPAKSGRKTTTLVRDYKYLIPTEFHQNPSSSSGKEVENAKNLRTDDARRAMTIAYLRAFGAGELKRINKNQTKYAYLSRV